MEKTINEVEYKDGFNRGFWLFNYEPDVAKLLIQSEVNRQDDFSTGFAEGLAQAEQEKTIREFEQVLNVSHDEDKNINIFTR